MLNSILTARSLSSNDLSTLAQIFETTLQYYCTHTSPFKDNYIKKLSTLIGLGFTTVLVDGDLLTIYEQRLQTFIRYYRNFTTYPELISTLSYAIAEMIDGATFLFRFERPKYYDEFMMTVKNALTHVTTLEAGKVAEAERLIQILFQKR